MPDTQAIGDMLKYLRWAAGHVGVITELLTLPDKLKAATTIEAKLDVVVWALGVLRPALADFPREEEVVTLAEDQVKAQVVAAGLDWAALMALLPMIVPIIKALLELFKSTPTTGTVRVSAR